MLDTRRVEKRPKKKNKWQLARGMDLLLLLLLLLERILGGKEEREYNGNNSHEKRGRETEMNVDECQVVNLSRSLCRVYACTRFIFPSSLSPCSFSSSRLSFMLLCSTSTWQRKEKYERGSANCGRWIIQLDTADTACVFLWVCASEEKRGERWEERRREKKKKGCALITSKVTISSPFFNVHILNLNLAVYNIEKIGTTLHIIQL